MTSAIPDEAIQAMQETAVSKLGLMLTDEDANALATADLPFLQCVKVKALEWYEDPEENRWNSYHAFGHDQIIWDPTRYSSGEKSFGLWDGGKWTWFDTIKAAKAAAQADYSARILSAIEPALSPRAQALEEAAKIAFDVSENGEYMGNGDCSGNSIFQQGARYVYDEICEEIRALSSPIADGCKAYVGEMQTSAGTDYFVMIKSGDRELSIRKHQHKHHADYEAAEYNWLFNGGEKPDILAYHPLPSSPGASEEPFPQPSRKDGGEPCAECHLQLGETCDICGATRPNGGSDV
jgi:hypothetical protein